MWEFSNEWGGVVGVLGGIAGAAIGGYYTRRDAAGPKERAFMVKGSLWILLVMLGVAIGLGYALGEAYKLLIWALTGLVLLTGIRIGNRQAAKISAAHPKEE